MESGRSMSEELPRSFTEHLETFGFIAHSIKGTSMLPILREGKDVALIGKKPQGRCCRYDVVLYRRNSGENVLHRIVRVRKKDYIICGDNCNYLEKGITDRQILGVMTGILRDGKEISVNDPQYLMYVKGQLRVMRRRVLRAELSRFLHRVIRK